MNLPQHPAPPHHLPFIHPATALFQIRRRNTQASSILIAAGLAIHAHAAESPATNPMIPSETFDDLWSHATLYKDGGNPILQEFKLRGRYQGQYWKTDDSSGNEDHWEDRRSRFGFDAKLFEKQLEVRADFQSNDGFEDIYDGLVDAYLRWKPVSWLSLTAGKTKPLIGQYDWLESTNTQPTFERSQIFNQLGINRATAFTIEGTTGFWSWRAGLYSNDTPSNTGGTGAFGDGEFGDINGGHAFSIGAGYDFKTCLQLDQADLRLDWLHSERETGDLVLNKYDDILSASAVLKQDAAALVVEGYFATGGTGPDSDVFGFFIQPTYDLLPGQLQLVGRYSFAHSDGPLGVVGQGRYERSVADFAGRGDEYHALYAGIQYFIYGDKLKLMAGTEWARVSGDAEAYDGFTYLTGLRFSF